jgi:hypothetical protein
MPMDYESAFRELSWAECLLKQIPSLKVHFKGLPDIPTLLYSNPPLECCTFGEMMNEADLDSRLSPSSRHRLRTLKDVQLPTVLMIAHRSLRTKKVLRGCQEDHVRT